MVPLLQFQFLPNRVPAHGQTWHRNYRAAKRAVVLDINPSSRRLPARQQNRAAEADKVTWMPTASSHPRTRPCAPLIMMAGAATWLMPRPVGGR